MMVQMFFDSMLAGVETAKIYFYNARSSDFACSRVERVDWANCRRLCKVCFRNIRNLLLILCVIRKCTVVKDILDGEAYSCCGKASIRSGYC